MGEDAGEDVGKDAGKMPAGKKRSGDILEGAGEGYE